MATCTCLGAVMSAARFSRVFPSLRSRSRYAATPVNPCRFMSIASKRTKHEEQQPVCPRVRKVEEKRPHVQDAPSYSDLVRQEENSYKGRERKRRSAERDQGTKTKDVGRVPASPAYISLDALTGKDSEEMKANADDGWDTFTDTSKTVNKAALLSLAQQPLPPRQQQSSGSTDAASAYMQWQLPLLQPPEQPASPRLLRASLLGAPNTGKSTLCNALLGQKLAIVSHRQQTTKERLMAVLTEDDTQVLLYDTPGVLHADEIRKLKVSKTIASDGRTSIADADLVLALVDGSQPFTQREADALKAPLRGAKNRALIINKIDLVSDRPRLLPFVSHASSLLGVYFTETFMVSALDGSGIDDLKAYLVEQAQPGEWVFGKNTVTDMSPLRRVEDQIREKLMVIAEEIPYETVQQNIDCRWDDDGTLFIHQALWVQKRGQLRIIAGKMGGRIQRIRDEVTAEMQEIFGVPVNLRLDVKIRKR